LPAGKGKKCLSRFEDGDEIIPDALEAPPGRGETSCVVVYPGNIGTGLSAAWRGHIGETSRAADVCGGVFVCQALRCSRLPPRSSPPASFEGRLRRPRRRRWGTSFPVPQRDGRFSCNESRNTTPPQRRPGSCSFVVRVRRGGRVHSRPRTVTQDRAASSVHRLGNGVHSCKIVLQSGSFRQERILFLYFISQQSTSTLSFPQTRIRGGLSEPSRKILLLHVTEWLSPRFWENVR
jgi:hypothetical protein